MLGKCQDRQVAQHGVPVGVYKALGLSAGFGQHLARLLHGISASRALQPQRLARLNVAAYKYAPPQSAALNVRTCTLTASWLLATLHVTHRGPHELRVAVEHAADAKVAQLHDVACAERQLVSDLLARARKRRAACAGAVRAPAGRAPRTFADEDVGALEVAVEDVLRVHVPQRQHDLHEPACSSTRSAVGGALLRSLNAPAAAATHQNMISSSENGLRWRARCAIVALRSPSEAYSMMMFRQPFCA
jgi:hypothetical protein